MGPAQLHAGSLQCVSDSRMPAVEQDAGLDRRQSSSVQLDCLSQIGLGELVAPQLEAPCFQPVGNGLPRDAKLVCEVVGGGPSLVTLDELSQFCGVQPLVFTQSDSPL
jgi:hypothetical protein